ncbi:MAG: transposase [Sphaerochaetaceae bacterium]|nr:transposase [Sphaerochaetaceae bacterium]
MEKFNNSFYRNSDFKKNRYFAREDFVPIINEARKHGREVLYNQIRMLNNCKYARILNGDVSIQDIFIKCWKEFKKKYVHRIRESVIRSVEQMIECHDFSNGYLYYECPNCDNFYMIGFSCHSRFCQSCGQKYKKARTESVSEKLLNVPHRQFVFTVPMQLREYFQRDRRLLNVLFTSSYEALNQCLYRASKKLYKEEKRRLGVISFLHTFGRDLKWHPHVHMLVAERYIDKDGNFHKFDYFHFNYLRVTFQNILLHNIYVFFKDVVKNYKLAQKVYKTSVEIREKYKDGYYVYGPKFNETNTTTSDMKSLANYIARYASHPAISERRIISFDPVNKMVKWFYDPHEDEDIIDEDKKLGRQVIEESAEEFIKRIIIHIPEKGFQQIRYYGFYSNKFSTTINMSSLFSKRQLKKMEDDTKWINGLVNSFGYSPLLCHCGNTMIFNHKLSYFPKNGGP